jgi:hypothetical protein
VFHSSPVVVVKGRSCREDLGNVGQYLQDYTAEHLFVWRFCGYTQLGEFEYVTRMLGPNRVGNVGMNLQSSKFLLQTYGKNWACINCKDNCSCKILYFNKHYLSTLCTCRLTSDSSHYISFTLIHGKLRSKTRATLWGHMTQWDQSPVPYNRRLWTGTTRRVKLTRFVGVIINSALTNKSINKVNLGWSLGIRFPTLWCLKSSCILYCAEKLITVWSA